MNPNTALPAGVLLALSLFFVVLAAPAQAGPFLETSDTLWTYGDRVVECFDRTLCAEVNPDPCGKEAVNDACALGRQADSWCDPDADCTIRDPSDDRDHDLLPDSAESNACGRRATRDTLSRVKSHYTECSTNRDMSGLPDEDRDGVPEPVEALVCAVEDQTTDLDGSCNGDDWSLGSGSNLQIDLQAADLDGPCRPYPDNATTVVYAYCATMGSERALAMFLDNATSGQYQSVREAYQGAMLLKGRVVTCITDTGNKTCPTKALLLAATNLETCEPIVIGGSPPQAGIVWACILNPPLP